MTPDLSSLCDAIYPEFVPYKNAPCGGWAGYVVDLGETIAFVGLGGEVVPLVENGDMLDWDAGRHVIDGWDTYSNMPLQDDEPDAADWWKS